MKKQNISLFCIFLLMNSLSGCGSTQNESAEPSTVATGAHHVYESVQGSDTSSLPKAELISSDGSAKVSISGNQFVVGEEQTPLWICGANTPWDNWNDFGKDFDYTFWDTHFADLKENGINATRVWLMTSGDYGINIDENGMVSGATDYFWASVDCLMEIAAKNEIYIMATMLSFDCCKEGNANYKKWRAFLSDDAAVESYTENVLIPFCKRYDSNDYLWSIDLCNEPDWIVENKECGKLDWKGLVTYFAKSSAAIHQNSDILVTTGMAMPKYHSDSLLGDYVGDTAMKQYGGENACMDFISVHYYEWMNPYWGCAYTESPAEYGGMDDRKPCILGECPAYGTKEKNLADCAVIAKEKGWQGVMPWTSNGVDDNGGFEEVAAFGQRMSE